MDASFAIVGLGNPGSRYEGTRHNIGFEVVRLLASDSLREAGARRGKVSWQEKLGCLFTKETVSGLQCVLILPQRFMNLSGQAAVPLLNYLRIEPGQVVVVHDEVDLPTGVIRCKLGGSAAGHNGVSDMQRMLGTANFYRIRVGIGRPGAEPSAATSAGLSAGEPEHIADATNSVRQDVSAWVLSRPGPKEKELLEKAIPDACDAIRTLITAGLEQAQQKYHGIAKGRS